MCKPFAVQPRTCARSPLHCKNIYGCNQQVKLLLASASSHKCLVMEACYSLKLQIPLLKFGYLR